MSICICIVYQDVIVARHLDGRLLQDPRLPREVVQELLQHVVMADIVVAYLVMAFICLARWSRSCCNM